MIRCEMEFKHWQWITFYLQIRSKMYLKVYERKIQTLLSNMVGRYAYGHNLEFDTLQITYKGFSKELLEQALTEIDEYNPKDILEIPYESSWPTFIKVNGGHMPGPRTTKIFYREVSVYVVRRFLKQLIHSKIV